MRNYNIILEYTIYKKYPRYKVYNVIRTIIDKTNRVISKGIIYKTTSPPKKAITYE